MKLPNYYRPLFAYVVYNDEGKAIASFLDANDAFNFKWEKFNYFGLVIITDYLY